ncbi:hypothetical protein E1B28_009502 [Marasmius oreades]|uniref:Uncharacterized protein n=1 Tax=Marasmius oreades TaxID=181124 RepID=A0A9P7RVU7_9AGAR|nr:uncharacterized protein E1B28_009502 [Marasmius oreades]KAG7090383.1 hypothetical protein E1B28_009502 [Marasmius oreades]
MHKQAKTSSTLTKRCIVACILSAKDTLMQHFVSKTHLTFTSPNLPLLTASEYIKTRVLNHNVGEVKASEVEAESVGQDDGPGNDMAAKAGPESHAVDVPTTTSWTPTSATAAPPSITPAVSSLSTNKAGKITTTVQTVDPPTTPSLLASPTVDLSTNWQLAPPITGPSLDGAPLRLSSPTLAYHNHTSSDINTYGHLLSNSRELDPQYNNPDMFMGMNMDMNTWWDWAQYDSKNQAMQTMRGIGSEQGHEVTFDVDGTLISTGASAVGNPTPTLIGLQLTSETHQTPMILSNENYGADIDSLMGQHAPTSSVSAYPLASQRPALTQLPLQIQPNIAKLVSDGKENTLKWKLEDCSEKDPKRPKIVTVEEAGREDVEVRDGENDNKKQGEEEVGTGRRKRNMKAPVCEPKTVTAVEVEETSKKSAGKSKGTKSTNSTQKTKGQGKKSKPT